MIRSQAARPAAAGEGRAVPPGTDDGIPPPPPGHPVGGVWTGEPSVDIPSSPGAHGQPPARSRPKSEARSTPGIDAGALLQAAAAAAGLGSRAASPAQATPSRGDQDVSPWPTRAASEASGHGQVQQPIESLGEATSAEEPRRPVREFIGLVPGRKAPALPTAAVQDQAHPAAPVPGTRATVETGSLHPAHAIDPRTIDGTGADGAILHSAAHLRIPGVPGGLGDIELHLRVRGSVAYVRIDGEAGRSAAASAPELATALASAGLSLGRLDTPPVAPTTSSSSSGGFGDRPGTNPGQGHFNSQPQGQPEPRDRGEAATPQHPRGTRDPAGRTPAHGARVHVEA